MGMKDEIQSIKIWFTLRFTKKVSIWKIINIIIKRRIYFNKEIFICLSDISGIFNIKYSRTSVYVCFGLSSTLYMTCLDAKNVVWYSTLLRNMTRVRQMEIVKWMDDKNFAEKYNSSNAQTSCRNYYCHEWSAV